MWKNKVVLKSDEELKFENSKTVGYMGEEDIETYFIVRTDGTKTGTVKLIDHTAVKGLRRTLRVIQTDIDGKTVVDSSFAAE